MAKNSHFLNVGQIREACKKYPYILARFPSGYQMGINSKVIHIAEKRGNHNGNDRTDFVSFLACDFHTYISKKHPFIKT